MGRGRGKLLVQMLAIAISVSENITFLPANPNNLEVFELPVN